MPITRTFLGLQQPPLHAAADYLIDRHRQGRVVEMSETLVVLPASQAARRLLEILVQRTESSSLMLTPPTIQTVGRLPESLYRPQRPFADELVQQLAWADVLRNVEPHRLARLLAAPPEPEDRLQWLELARHLSRLHTELAADGLDFSDVADRLRDMQAPAERQRWDVLRRAQRAYLGLLDAAGLWDVQTARLVAIDHRECRTDKDIVVAGAVDMTNTLRRMLDQVADRVTALVFAPPAWADRFDRHGCLVPQAWQESDLDVDARCVHVVEGPEEEADRVARCLAGYGGRYRADEITIGLADQRIARRVQRLLRQCGIASRDAAGSPMAQTGPCRLLQAIQAYLENDGFSEFAALVRHPEIEDWLGRQKIRDGWMERLDEYIAEHLQARMDDGCPGDESAARAVRKVYRRIAELTAPLRGDKRRLDDWDDPLRALLLAVYGHRDWDREDDADRPVLLALEQIGATLSRYTVTIPPSLMPTVSAAEAIALSLEQLATSPIPPPRDADAVELLGWLELPWDDAPALVVCGFAEGFVPSSTGTDMFLPNALRSRLGVQDDRRRYARDAYALSVLLATRQRLDLIVPRHDADGDPLAPSRLLFATDAEQVAERARRWFQPPEPLHSLPPLAGRLAAGGQAALAVPPPAPLAEPITELRVTAFRDYLACPYRFYLRHVLKLEAADDRGEELDAARFGSLLHDVLREFGQGPHRDSTDPDEIRSVLCAALDRRVAHAYGQNALASVHVQIEQLRTRLNAFAAKQAAWAADGWSIQHTEVAGEGQRGAEFEVDGRPFLLRGRIDRIDVHRETGEHIIFDYKSSDSARPPEKQHQRSGAWIDLQLPLYRYLARSLGIHGAVRLGYILLPKDVAKIEFRLADWSEAELDEADEVARGVVRDIRDQRFWPPADPAPDFSEEFAPICQDGVFERRLGDA